MHAVKPKIVCLPIWNDHWWVRGPGVLSALGKVRGAVAISRVVYCRFFSTQGVNPILALTYCLGLFLLASQTSYLLYLGYLLARAHLILMPDLL